VLFVYKCCSASKTRSRLRLRHAVPCCTGRDTCFKVPLLAYIHVKICSSHLLPGLALPHNDPDYKSLILKSGVIYPVSCFQHPSHAWSLFVERICCSTSRTHSSSYVHGSLLHEWNRLSTLLVSLLRSVLLFTTLFAPDTMRSYCTARLTRSRYITIRTESILRLYSAVSRLFSLGIAAVTPRAPFGGKIQTKNHTSASQELVLT